MKTVTLAVWSLITIVAVAMALLMLAAITVSALVLLVLAISLLPAEGVLRLMSLASPAVDRWTSRQYERFVDWLNRMRPRA